jgi:hypothetical protein
MEIGKVKLFPTFKSNKSLSIWFKERRQEIGVWNRDFEVNLPQR